MTNYQKWDKWDADVESEKVSARESSDELELHAAKEEKKLLAQLGRVDIQTKQVAEAFRSQAAVDALKAKGGMRARRKRGAAVGSGEIVAITSSSDSCEDPTEFTPPQSTHNTSSPNEDETQSRAYCITGRSSVSAESIVVDSMAVVTALDSFSGKLTGVVAQNTALMKLMHVRTTFDACDDFFYNSLVFAASA